jgi:hypothetical protein
MADASIASVLTSVIPAIIGLLGVALGAGLGELREVCQRKKRHLSYWSAMSAEVDLCRGLAEAYCRDPVKAPLYRLPTVAYENGCPALLADGAVSEEEARSILRFYGQVEQINRGLEYAHAARDRSPQEVLDQEASRLKLKANNLIDPNCDDPGGAYYDRVRAAINKYVRSPRGSKGK